MCIEYQIVFFSMVYSVQYSRGDCGLLQTIWRAHDEYSLIMDDRHSEMVCRWLSNPATSVCIILYMYHVEHRNIYICMRIISERVQWVDLCFVQTFHL